MSKSLLTLLFLLAVFLLNCQETFAQSFLDQLFNDNAFRRAQIDITKYSSASYQAGRRGTVSGYGAYASGYNGYQRFQTGHQSGFMYTSRYYGSGPR
jgi:hypothetical protein